jgi:putative tryptophan/tyrosine transport system substrate-binding protein
VRRREFITLLGGAAVAWPMAAHAQEGRMRRIAVLTEYAASDPEGQARVGAFRRGLRELGWIDSRNVWIDVRWAAADPSLLRAYAAELVEMMPDVILVNNAQGLTAVQRARRDIAIVFAGVSDPVGLHFVDSLARPGGNVTGFTTFEFSPVAKLLEALKEIAPSVTRVALIFDPDNPSSAGHLHSFESAAPSFAVKSIAASVHSPVEIERAIEDFARERDGGLLVPPNTTLTSHRDLIVGLAARFRLPAVYPFKVFVTAGGLMSYGADRVEQFLRAASYVDRILKGAKPGDLPVQQPSKFELFINLKTAKTMGLDVPPTLLARADEVIE